MVFCILFEIREHQQYLYLYLYLQTDKVFLCLYLNTINVFDPMSV